MSKGCSKHRHITGQEPVSEQAEGKGQVIEQNHAYLCYQKQANNHTGFLQTYYQYSTVNIMQAIREYKVCSLEGLKSLALSTSFGELRWWQYVGLTGVVTEQFLDLT